MKQHSIYKQMLSTSRCKIHITSCILHILCLHTSIYNTLIISTYIGDKQILFEPAYLNLHHSSSSCHISYKMSINNDSAYFLWLTDLLKFDGLRGMGNIVHVCVTGHGLHLSNDMRIQICSEHIQRETLANIFAEINK